MTTGITKSTSVIGVAEEVTEGTWVTPSAWLQPLPGFEVSSTKEELAREIITSALTRPTPRSGLKSTSVTLPLEWKASGTEGAVPEMDLIVKSMLGSRRQITTQTTSKASGNTTSVLQIEDADISKFTIGDLIVALDATNGYHPCFVTAVDTTGGAANITVSPAAGTAFVNSCVISKSTTYYPANSGHTSLSVSTYWADEILEKSIGCKVASMSLDNYNTAALASANYTLQGMDFDRIDGSSSSPTYLSGLPPVLLQACIYQDGTSLPMNSFGLSIANTISQIKSLCSADGVTSQRITLREITGTMTPYMDDTTVTQFTKWNNLTEYAVIAIAYIPHSTLGVTLGSVVGIYLPQVITTNTPVSELDDVLIDNIEYKATGGSAGTSTDIFIGFV